VLASRWERRTLFVHLSGRRLLLGALENSQRRCGRINQGIVDSLSVVYLGIV
jgi:hypothetical protein